MPYNKSDGTYDYDFDAATDTWRLYSVDFDEPCSVKDCDAMQSTWTFRGLPYCKACAQQLRDVLDRLVEATG